jgi:hypothetical protein
MKKTDLELRKNIFDLAKELAIIVDEIDQKKLTKKQIR